MPEANDSSASVTVAVLGADVVITMLPTADDPRPYRQPLEAGTLAGILCVGVIVGASGG